MPIDEDTEVIGQYAQSKGADISGCNTPIEMIHAQLMHEYGRIARVLEGKKKATVVGRFLDDISFLQSRVNQMEPRESSSETAASPILGVLTEVNGVIALIDGHHRIKWAQDNGVEEGKFIFIY